MARIRLALILLVLAPLSAARVFAQVNVYVQAGDGNFAAEGAGDSASDLVKALQSKPRLRVVESPSEADIIVQIGSRERHTEVSSLSTTSTTNTTSSSTNNSDSKTKTTTTTTTPNTQTILVIHGTLVAGDFHMVVDSSSGLSWRSAAGNMATSVDRWAEKNYSKIMNMRQQSAPAASAPPPPPPSAQSTAAPTESTSISLGMSEDDVIKAMGQPDKKVAFGAKSLWTYRGMQVVFENGKVTDVKF